MATDISKVGNAIHITYPSTPIKAFVGLSASYSFNAAGTTLSLKMGATGNSFDTDILFSDLTVAGAAPASVAAAYTALSAVFGIYP